MTPRWTIKRGGRTFSVYASTRQEAAWKFERSQAIGLPKDDEVFPCLDGAYCRPRNVIVDGLEGQKLVFNSSGVCGVTVPGPKSNGLTNGVHASAVPYLNGAAE